MKAANPGNETTERLASYATGQVEEREPGTERRVNHLKSFFYKLNMKDRRSGIDRRRSDLPTL